MRKRVVIVGGVAGGMSCAARLRRLDESLEVTVFEKGPDVSFANCGMPYFIGGEIEDRAMMNVQTAEGMSARYGISVKTRHEVLRIDRDAHEVEVRNLETAQTFRQAYDYLVVAPGAAPICPPLPGADGDKVYTLSNLVDMDAITAAADNAKHACVIGGGFIGLEMAESLHRRGLEVTVVEMLDHVMPPLDVEMAQPLHAELRGKGIALHLESKAEAITADGKVQLGGGGTIHSDLVVMSVGVRPRTAIMHDAGITCNERGYIKVDEHLRTSDPDIFAVGDAVEVKNLVTGQPAMIPLAGPANRQGRIVADNICGRDVTYHGSQGTSILRLFSLAVGQVGLNEHQVRAAMLPYHRIYVHPTQHPNYFPGATPIDVKLLFTPEGRILGAQAVGAEGVETLIDVIATAQRHNLTTEDLEHLELAYSPQWGAAKHPVNMVGFVASNVLRGDVELVEADAQPDDILFLDVRNPPELEETGTVPGAAHIPLDQLRERYEELPKKRRIGVFCAVGLRGYIAYRFLKQHGYDVVNLDGGFRTLKCMEGSGACAPATWPGQGGG
ncbi:MAG: FAD-dependent oxidoreductase [Candidatus Hydrogenedentota bacterium]